jgi:hypothetical protein
MFGDETEIRGKNRSGSGIYPERAISYVKIEMILIGSKLIQKDPELLSLRFTGRDTGSLC